MERPYDLHGVIEAVMELDGLVTALEYAVGELQRRFDKLVTVSQDAHLVDRPPPRIPPFPKELRQLGLQPPKKRRLVHGDAAPAPDSS